MHAKTVGRSDCLSLQFTARRPGFTERFLHRLWAVSPKLDESIELRKRCGGTPRQVPPHMSRGHKDSSASLWTGTFSGKWQFQEHGDSCFQQNCYRTHLAQLHRQTSPFTEGANARRNNSMGTAINGNFWKGRTEHTDSVPRGMRAA